MTTNHIIGIEIEGIGFSSEHSDPTLFTTGRVPASYDDPNNERILPVLQDDISNVGLVADMFVSELEGSRFTFSLNGHDAIAERLLYRQIQAPFSLRSSIGIGDTVIPMDGGSSEMEGDVIYIQEEAILLGTWQSGSETFTGSVRGYHGSGRSNHVQGALIFTKVPSWRYRKVNIKVWMPSKQSDGSYQQEWISLPSGYLADDPYTNEGGTSIILKVRDSVHAFKRCRVNKDPKTYQVDPLSDWVPSITRYNQNQTALEGGFGAVGTSSVWKQGEFGLGRDRVSAYKVDGAVIVANEGYVAFETAKLGSSFDGKPSESGSSTTVEDSDIKELFVVSRTLDEYALAEYGTEVSPTSLMPYPYHPLTIVGALLCSSSLTRATASKYDVLHGNLGADLGWLLTSDFTDHLDELIEATSHLEVDLMVLGYDDEDNQSGVSLYRKVISILRQYGFYLGTDEQGFITIRRLGVFDQTEFGGAPLLDLYDNQMRWRAASKTSLDAITARVGPDLWDDPVTVEVQTEGTSERASYLADVREHTLDYDTYFPSSAQTLAQTTLASQSVLRYWGLPTLEIRVPSPYMYADDRSYGIGAVVSLKGFDIESKWLINNGGERIRGDISDDIQFAGIITERETNITDMSVTLVVTLTNYRLGQAPRLRGPSAEIIDVDYRDAVITVPSASTFGESSTYNDLRYFTGSYEANGSTEVSFWTRGGQRIPTSEEGPASIESPYYDENEQLQNPLGLVGNKVQIKNLPLEVEEGHIMRLCGTRQGWTPYQEWNPLFPNMIDPQREWTFFADDEGEIELSDGSLEEADIYG